VSTPGRPREYTDADLLDAIRRLADGDRPPTMDTFNAQARMSTETVAHRFGSWREAVAAAGLEPRPIGGYREYTDAEIVAELRRVADGDQPPTAAEFDAEADMTRQLATKRFGSWARARGRRLRWR